MKTLTGNYVKQGKCYLISKTLKTMCYAIFEPHLHRSCLFWVENLNSIKKTFYFAKEILKAHIFFKSLCSDVTPTQRIQDYKIV